MYMMEYSNAQLLLAVATAVGSYGGFPAAPVTVQRALQNPAAQWAVLFVLVWQGGSGQDPKLAALVVAAMFAVAQVL